MSESLAKNLRHFISTTEGNFPKNHQQVALDGYVAEMND